MNNKLDSTIIKEKFKSDPQRQQKELMGFMSANKVNPMKGCLPILPQIPVFIAFYRVLSQAIELRHAPFMLWITDLSAADTLFSDLLGLGFALGPLPLIMGFTMFLQQKLNPAPTDPIQAKVFMFMPIMFTFLLAQFPAGLVIYWAWNNTLSMSQQWMIMRRMGVAVGGGKIEDAK